MQTVGWVLKYRLTNSLYTLYQMYHCHTGQLFQPMQLFFINLSQLTLIILQAPNCFSFFRLISVFCFNVILQSISKLTLRKYKIYFFPMLLTSFPHSPTAQSDHDYWKLIENSNFIVQTHNICRFLSMYVPGGSKVG